MTVEEKDLYARIERAIFDGNLGEELTGIPDELVADELPEKFDGTYEWRDEEWILDNW